MVTEVESIPGYTIDPNTQSQTVVINPNDTQELYFYNNPIGGIEIIKVNASKTSERIPDTTFEIRRMDDALVDTITTDRNGRAISPWRTAPIMQLKSKQIPTSVWTIPPIISRSKTEK